MCVLDVGGAVNRRSEPDSGLSCVCVCVCRVLRVRCVLGSEPDSGLSCVCVCWTAQ